jgi:hypothetical protein
MLRGKWIAWIAIAGGVVALGSAVFSAVGMCIVTFAAGAWIYSLWHRHTPRFSMLFLSLAFLAYAIADLGFGVYAGVHVANQDIADSLRQTLYYGALQPLGTLLLIAPFLFLGWLGASVAHKRGVPIGIAMFAVGAVLLSYMYFTAHIDSRLSMLAHKWTAAALSTGLLPFQSLLVLVPLFFAAMFLKRNGSPENT